MMTPPASPVTAAKMELGVRKVLSVDSEDMKVLIVGAGIAGISLGLALRKANIEFHLFERAPALERVGAGIQLSPNATRVLGYLGVLDSLLGKIVHPGRHRFVDWKTGEAMLVTPLGDLVRETFGSPYAHAHRADLLEVLEGAVDLSACATMGAEVTAVGQRDTGVWLEVNGKTVQGDVLIAADGVRSRIREALFEPVTPRASGCMAWRGLTPADVIADLGFERDSHIWMGPGRSVVIYYVSAGRLLNWIGIGPSDGETEESWTTEGTVDEALAEFEGWHPSVRGLIERSAAPYKWALFDREPLARWVEGRIALIGDAAHAMLPYHAQGAAQSLEDAWVLARALESAASPEAGLMRYAALRQPRTRQVQEASRAAERLFHLEDPREVARRNARFARAQAAIGDGFPPGQEWLFAYDAEKAVRGTDDAWQTLAWRS